MRYLITMKCPSCKNITLILELQQVEIDYCPSCGGIWLDSGELEILLGSAREREILLGSFVFDNASRERKLRCPKCARKMAKVRFAENPNILVDLCPNNHGIWLDKGELLELVDRQNFAGNPRILEILRGIFKKTANPDKTGE